MTSTRNLVWILALAIVALAFLRLGPRAAREDTLLGSYTALLEVDALVRRHHVSAPNVESLQAHAIDGIMTGLDRFSCYLDSPAYAAYRRRLAGEDVGLGLELADGYGYPIVIGATEGDPAAEVGIQPGDVILAVDDTPTAGLSLLSVEGLLGGPAGTTVTLTVQRPPNDERLTFTASRRTQAKTLVRGIAQHNDRWQWMIDAEAGIGYLRISSFRAKTITQADEALAEMRQQGFRGLIVDVRNNPGGLIPQATALADRFLEDGLIVRTVSREGAETAYTARSPSTDRNTVLAVLIDGASASAAELFAGALQDRQRAIVVGERSFGKGSVQYILELADGQTALRMTTAYYELPSGRRVHRSPQAVADDTWGVTPDVHVALTDAQRQQVRTAHLATGETGTIDLESLLALDAQLKAAVNAVTTRLKGAPTRSENSKE